MAGSFLINALISALVIAVIAYIADYFASQAGLGFPRQIIWLVALIFWLVIIFGGGLGLR